MVRIYSGTSFSYTSFSFVYIITLLLYLVYYRVELLKLVIENIPHFWSKYSTAPKTLTHNDCNPRNICIKNPAGGGTLKEPPSETFPYSDTRTTCIYDWELARVDLPQHDVAEFLAFTLPVDTDMGTRLELIEFYRKHFELYGGVDYPMNRLANSMQWH